MTSRVGVTVDAVAWTAVATHRPPPATPTGKEVTAVADHYVVLREPLWTDNDVEVYDSLGAARDAWEELGRDVAAGDEEGDFRIYRLAPADADE